jgi:hypothetical protein
LGDGLMDCVFKSLGYVPKHKICLHCRPLEDLLRNNGFESKNINNVVNQIFRIYSLLKADDILRDEKNIFKRSYAKIVKKIGCIGLSKELKDLVKESDKTLSKLESRNAGEEEYIEKVSNIGGEIFQKVTRDKSSFSLGKSTSAITLILDMIKDFKDDKKKGRFNPLKNLYCDISNIKFNIIINKYQKEFSSLNFYSQQSNIVGSSAGCFQICVGVCGGICSSILLYRCCCG